MKKKFYLILTSSVMLFFTSCNKEEVKPTEPTTTTPKSYSNFKITSIKLNQIPFVDNTGSSWDTSSGPDLFYKLTDVGSNVYSTGSQFDDLTSSELPLLWNFQQAFQITNLNTTFFVQFYDHDDLDPDDYIGGVGFNASLYTDTYPTSIPLTYNGISVIINGVWY